MLVFETEVHLSFVFVSLLALFLYVSLPNVCDISEFWINDVVLSSSASATDNLGIRIVAPHSLSAEPRIIYRCQTSTPLHSF